MLLLNFITLGYYNYWWDYELWRRYRASGEDIWPVPRAAFCPMISLFLYKRLDKALRAPNMPFAPPRNWRYVGLLALGVYTLPYVAASGFDGSPGLVAAVEIFVNVTMLVPRLYYQAHMNAAVLLENPSASVSDALTPVERTVGLWLMVIAIVFFFSHWYEDKEPEKDGKPKTSRFPTPRQWPPVRPTPGPAAPEPKPPTPPSAEH